MDKQKKFATLVTITQYGAMVTSYFRAASALRSMLEFAETDRAMGWTTTLVETDQWHLTEISF